MPTVLGFDFGLKRIGVATGETSLGHAHALTAIQGESNELRFAAIEKLLKEWQPSDLVVGLPCHLDGTPHEMTARATRFAQQLHGRYAQSYRLKVHLVDERLTSALADHKLREAGQRDWKKRKVMLDAQSAAEIVQSWLDAPQQCQTLPLAKSSEPGLEPSTTELSATDSKNPL